MLMKAGHYKKLCLCGACVIFLLGQALIQNQFTEQHFNSPSPWVRNRSCDSSNSMVYRVSWMIRFQRKEILIWSQSQYSFVGFSWQSQSNPSLPGLSDGSVVLGLSKCTKISIEGSFVTQYASHFFVKKNFTVKIMTYSIVCFNVLWLNMYEIRKIWEPYLMI